MAEATKNEQEAQGTPQTAEEDPVQAVLDRYTSYRAEAEAIKSEKDYKGTLTSAMFTALQTLLYKPTDPAYIQHSKAKSEGNPTGLPYATTGVRSMQYQFDRFNDVLGAQHWRTLLHFDKDGTVCKCVGLVGNDLQWARLDDTGRLIPFTVLPGERTQVETADIIAQVEGWGGHKGPTTGLSYKGSETNATKRCLAKLGPAADMYRVDYDLDTLAAMGVIQESSGGGQSRSRASAQAGRQSAQAQAAPQPQMTDQQAATALIALLNEDGVAPELKAKRQETYAALQDLGDRFPGTVKAYELILARKDDERQLDSLIDRAKNS